MKLYLIIIFVMFLSSAHAAEIIRNNNSKYTNYETYIIANNVNVREYPSLDGDVVSQLNNGDAVTVSGVSSQIETINDIQGFWLNIFGKGWVFSKYVNNSNALKPSIMKVEKLKKGDNSLDEITLALEHNSKISIITVWARKIIGQNFYTFAMNGGELYSYYFVTPGTYVYFPDENKIQHISYYGFDSPGEVYLTDDFKYLIQQEPNYGNSFPITVRNLANRKIIFKGNWISNSKTLIDHHEIEIVWEPSETDKEITDFVNEYKKSHPMPIPRKGFSMSLYVICKLNLDTNKKKVVECKYLSSN